MVVADLVYLVSRCCRNECQTTALQRLLRLFLFLVLLNGMEQRKTENKRQSSYLSIEQPALYFVTMCDS